MISKPRTLIGFNEDIIRVFGLLDHEIDPDNGNTDCPGSLTGSINKVSEQ